MIVLFCIILFFITRFLNIEEVKHNGSQNMRMMKLYTYIKSTSPECTLSSDKYKYILWSVALFWSLQFQQTVIIPIVIFDHIFFNVSHCCSDGHRWSGET